MRRAFWAVVVGLVVTSPAVALGPEADQPYDFRVVVRVAPHRLLTPAFRRQLQADLRDSLQAALGATAAVQVLDADDPQAGGWLDPAALDAHSALSPVKRHFVEVSFAGGRYSVVARQLDGSTGLASPVVRRASTADRAFVSRLITRFIGQDFGIVGTVAGKDGDRVRLRFRGGALPSADLARWVPAGSVFALARIEGDPPRGRAVPDTYLQAIAEPRDGQCECRLVSRYIDDRKRDPLADWDRVTFRALLLGTSEAPVRLRLVDHYGLPVQGLQVSVSQVGLRPNDPARDQGAARNGAYETAASYDRIAFVRVSLGARSVALVPVPVLDDRTMVIEVKPEANGPAKEQVALDARNTRQRLSDILRRLMEQYRHLDVLAQNTQNSEALARVRQSLERLRGELDTLTPELTRLRREAQALGADVGPVLDQCDAYMLEIGKRRDFLARVEEDLRKAVEAETSPETQAKRDSVLSLYRKAEAQRGEADYEKAIATYKEILQKLGEQPEVRKKLEELEKGWELKGEEHRKAREFAYGPWANVKSFEDVRTRLPEAREALAACKTVGDMLTAHKLYLVASTAVTDAVVKTVEELEKSQLDEDKIRLKLAEQVSQELQGFIKEAGAFVREGEKK